MSDAGSTVEIVAGIGHINLRGDPERGAFREIAERVLGQPLPVTPNTVSEGSHRLCWLGPDEWSVVTAAGDVGELLEQLQTALDGEHAAVNDLSGGYAVVRVGGANSRQLLARGCTLDFHPAAFPPGSCAQSGLAKASVLFIHTDGSNAFDIVVRRSFLDYLTGWLRRAGDGLDVEFP